MLIGSNVNNTFRGDAGKDSFVFNTKLGASNVDTIQDFVVVDDTIRLDNAIFTKIVGLNTMTADQFVKNTTGNAADAKDRIIYETDTGNIYYDADGSGSGAKVLFAKVSVGLAMTEKDFYII
jgi:Ca2+-binding RTX toxin-like protein